ncbi:hypothetical protein JY97_16720 [Alkalispirochaeta odontotermitis]|uniref:glycosyltransferase n=1 Tax=Olavius algarvensis spirochete endosymbiont TaxID=260710 RepID=UPI00052B9940|nr:glycosyltransferase family 2 protein [Olavius algarvensis spirochete endosymbiont]KGM38356.1 hypothetical protein JY97_16720 [Alkalispirochaeta odontotermitis]
MKEGPMISVLIPARNEERRIIPTLEGLLSQEYSNFEVVVIDDNSSDGTWDIVNAYADRNKFMTALRGGELLEGWKGKPYAMTQLAEAAKGEIFVFLDADITPAPDFLSWVTDRLFRHKADSMSAYPRHRARSVREYIFFPLVYFVNSVLLPFWLIKPTKQSLFSHAIGQLMVFRREAYADSGGFAVVFNKILEDIQMGRAMKRAGYRHVFLDARDVLSGFMYDSWGHTIAGLKRSIYEYFDKKIYPLIIMSFFNIALLVVPAFLIPFILYYSSPQTPWIIWGNVGILLGWSITAFDRRLPWYVPFFYPVQFLCTVILSWGSVIDEVNGRGYDWKDRKVF